VRWLVSLDVQLPLMTGEGGPLVAYATALVGRIRESGVSQMSGSLRHRDD
jgi:hypothetical protein